MAYKDEKTRIVKSKEYYLANKERINARNKEYYKKNAKSLRAYSRKWYENNKEYAQSRSRTHSKEYYQKNKAKRSKYNIELWKKLKTDTFAVLGGAICVKCGFTDIRALQIDHKNGGGMKHIKSFSSNKTYLRYVRENPIQFQILCANCNWIKVSENRELYAKN